MLGASATSTLTPAASTASSTLPSATATRERRSSSPYRGIRHSPSHSLSSLQNSPKRSSWNASRALQPALQVGKVIGTTATSHASFCLAGGIVAYTAGAGVVLLSLDTDDLKNAKQRFFCTSAKVVHTIQQSIATASAVPPWLAEFSQNVPTPTRDSNGYLIGVNNDLVQSTSLGINNEDLSNLAGAKQTPAKDKMKTASCVAISNDANLLAVGETGHQPRVYIYSTAPESSSCTPLAILCEHRYGIKMISFSPCGKFLATLGVSTDGFLHIWKLSSLKEGSVSLHSSNRCISQVLDLKWMGSQTVVTVGVRHVRFWKVEESKAQWTDTKAHVLSGRNLVLNEFSNCVFVAVTALSSDIAVVATEKGDLATVQECDDKLTFTPRILSSGEDVSSVDFDAENELVWTGGASVKSYTLKQLLSSTLKPPVAPTSTVTKRSKYRAIGFTGEKQVVALTTSKDIAMLKNGQESVVIGSHAQELRGIRTVGEDRFLTWSSDGVVRVWNNKGECHEKYQVKLEFDIESTFAELTIAHLDAEGTRIIAGDNTGVVQVSDTQEGSISQSFVAHGSSVIGIDYFKCPDYEMFTTCSRDRTLQVFKRSLKPMGSWELHQTLPAHRGNIIAVSFTKDGQRIISCSADRSIAVHKLLQNDQGEIVFVMERTISMKSTPQAMCMDPLNEKIVVSCDKTILIYNVTGEQVGTYRCQDETDAVNLTSISIGEMGGNVFLAGMGQDKGIRVYDHSSRFYIGTDWGHSEGISGISWIKDGPQCKIVSTGYDGCIFLWEISQPQQQQQLTQQTPHPLSMQAPPLSSHSSSASSQSNGNSQPAARISPTRKILSKQELAKFMAPPVAASNPPSTPGREREASPAPSPTNPSTPSPMKRPLVRAATSLGLRRKSLQPSKSLSELRKRPTDTVPPTPSLDSARTPPSKGAQSPQLQPPAGLRNSGVTGTSPSSRRNETDDAIASLVRFREVYKRSASRMDNAKLDRLKNELRLTCELLDSNPKMEDLLERFGDRLVGLVESRLNTEKLNSTQYNQENIPPTN